MHGIDCVARVQGRIHFLLARLRVKAYKTLFPHADENTSLLIFFERHHTARHPVVYELIVCFVITAGAG